MDRKSYYVAVLLLVASASNVFGGNVSDEKFGNVTVKNETTFDIGVLLETGGKKYWGGVVNKGVIVCDDVEEFIIKQGGSEKKMIGTSACPLIKVRARIRNKQHEAPIEPWSGNIKEDATFVVKPNPNDAASFIVVKE